MKLAGIRGRSVANPHRPDVCRSQHTEDTFKAILGSCQNVVNSLGTLKNKVGDAHGQGRKPLRPSKRHATLAVNPAGAMATFLVETYVERKSPE